MDAVDLICGTVFEWIFWRFKVLNGRPELVCLYPERRTSEPAELYKRTLIVLLDKGEQMQIENLGVLLIENSGLTVIQSVDEHPILNHKYSSADKAASHSAEIDGSHADIYWKTAEINQRLDTKAVSY